MPAQPKVIETKVVELFQKLDVEPVEDNDGDGQDAEEARVPQGGAVSCAARNDDEMLMISSWGVGTKNGRRHLLMLMKDGDSNGQDAEEARVPQGGAVSCTAHGDESNQDSRRSKRSLEKGRHRQLGRFSVFPISSGLEPGRSADTGTFTAAVEGPQEGNKTSVLERRTGSAAVVFRINPTLQDV
jgi:hypothetical protein